LSAINKTLSDFFPTPSKKDKQLAQQFLVGRVIETRNFGAVSIIDTLWESGPLDNRNWCFTLHAFLPLDCLIATGEKEALNELVDSWWRRFADAPIEDDFPWHDHATALRLDRLSRMAIQWDGFIHRELAAKHAKLLMEDSFYSKHTNHGFDQAISLILASKAFSDDPQAVSWRDMGIARVQDEIKFAFTSEGVHVENSPGYHVGMISNLVRARTIMNAVGVDIDTDIDTLYDKVLRFTAWITRPDRYLAYLGDTASYFPNIPDSLSYLPNYQWIRWVLTAGREGRHPEDTTAIFPESGYAIYRSRWNPWNGHLHLVMKCGFLSRYHRQDDDLNILLHAFGEDWLIDSGLYSHNQNDPVRVYMRSALAHNIPYLHGVRVNRSIQGSDRARIRKLETENAIFAVQGMTAMYSGGRVTRRLLVRDEITIEISDSFSAHSGVARCWLFHVPSDKKISITDGKETRIVGKYATLLIRPMAGLQIACAVHRGFVEPFPSVVSLNLGIFTDSQVIVFGPSDRKDITFRLEFDQRRLA
jgi:hypothetical protein